MTWNPISGASIDHVVVAGRRSPGIAVVEGAALTRRLDERRASGVAGGRPAYHGDELAKFVVKLRLITDADWEAWHAWKPIVLRPPGRSALGIEHPFLNDLGIQSVLVKGVKQPEQTADGEWTIAIDMLEYRQPRAGLARPDGTQNTAQAPVTDPADQEIERNSARIRELAAQ